MDKPSEIVVNVAVNYGEITGVYVGGIHEI